MKRRPKTARDAWDLAPDNARSLKAKKIGKLFLSRNWAADPNRSFKACVAFGGEGGAQMSRGRVLPCGYGRNPRAALAKAFREAAKFVNKRKGAFARHRRS